MARTRSNRSTSKSKSKSKSTVMEMRSSDEVGNMNSLIQQGPITIILVFSHTCPHCISYMPLWKKLCNTPNRNANMISMEASTYQNTPLAEKKQVTGVPSVLRVDEQGQITEIMDPRNMKTMTETITSEITERKNPLRPVLGTVQAGGATPWLAFLKARKSKSRKTQKRNRRKD